MKTHLVKVQMVLFAVMTMYLVKLWLMNVRGLEICLVNLMLCQCWSLVKLVYLPPAFLHIHVLIMFLTTLTALLTVMVVLQVIRVRMFSWEKVMLKGKFVCTPCAGIAAVINPPGLGQLPPGSAMIHEGESSASGQLCLVEAGVLDGVHEPGVHEPGDRSG